MTRGRFVVDLLAALPEAASVLAEHLDDQENDLLLHLLVADLRRLILDAWSQSRADLTKPGLMFLDER